MARVVLAMSGGVDSSVAACLLREQGHDVVGVFMRHGQEQPPSPPHPPSPPAPLPEGGGRLRQGCCTAADAADARRVADMLGIPFYTVNFQGEFTEIVEDFVVQYTAGRTPNPCIVCNTRLKFGKLFDYADRLGAEYVATGHYARLVFLSDGDVALCRGRDATKDQSYVLFGIQRRRLLRLMFPVGEHHKEEIREMAERLGLRVAAKRDSQEICFVPDQDHARFIRQRRGALNTSGDIVATDGTVLGHHDGFERFTIGQRKGLRLAFGQPRYVVRIEPDTRRVVIGVHEDLAREELTAGEANWLAEGWKTEQVASGQWLVASKPEISNPQSPIPDPSVSPHPAPFRAEVKIRYRSRPAAATVEPLDDRRFRVHFDQPCYGIAPGQAVVCYQRDRVLGGGWIE